jgi:hypothetical protein
MLVLPALREGANAGKTYSMFRNDGTCGGSNVKVIGLEPNALFSVLSTNNRTNTSGLSLGLTHRCHSSIYTKNKNDQDFFHDGVLFMK